MKPRKYQIEALQSIKKEFDRGIKRTLLIQATGTGKTIILNGIAFSFAYNSDRTPTGKRVLVLAHQNILLDQAAEKFKMAVSVDVTREKGTQTCIDSDLPIVVASVQTMQRRLEKFPSNYFDLIIVDEAHHSASKQYQ
ncbi:MAG: DEAD/DEAH box helicase family protein, partial [Allobaculum sp.]|nr:DEAD/DEAH box helicase family protein [Allobaculum sp.]